MQSSCILNKAIMNKEFYHNWIITQKNSGLTWQQIILSALENFSSKIPDQKPKQSTEIFLLFSYLSHELDTPVEVHSLLTDIMLYCEGEETGGYTNEQFNKIFLLEKLHEMTLSYQ